MHSAALLIFDPKYRVQLAEQGETKIGHTFLMGILSSLLQMLECLPHHVHLSPQYADNRAPCKRSSYPAQSKVVFVSDTLNWRSTWPHMA